MSPALVRKELRLLWPWAALALVLSLVDLAEQALGSPDQHPLGQTFPGLDLGGLWLWPLAFAIGTTLSTREEDDGHLAFLDGLPLTRSQVFFTKLGVAAAVLLCFPVLELARLAGLHLLSRGSLDHPLHGVLLAQALGLLALLVGNGLAVGAALSRLRSLTWLVAATAAVGLQLLVERVPRAGALDPLALGQLHTAGSRLRVDGEAVLVQVGLGVLALGLGWWGFLRAGRPRARLDLKARPVLGAVVSVLTVAAVVGVVALRWRESFTEAAAESRRGPSGPRFAPAAPAETFTARYRFSYPADQAAAALALADQADALFEAARERLQVPPGARIDVDLSGSMRGTEGTAFVGGLRMRLGPDAERTLVHETVHVLARRLSGEEQTSPWQRALVLDEGLATRVTELVRPAPEEHRAARLQLAAHLRRGELHLEELTDPEALARARDDRLKYTAGEALWEAVEAVYGQAAVQALVAAFGDPRLPPGESGLRLWQAAFQLAGMDLGRVADAFFGALDEEATARADELAALPRPRAVVVTDGKRHGARVVVAGALPEGLGLALRFRPEDRSGLKSYEVFSVAPREVVWRSPRAIRAGQLCLQAGVRLKGGSIIYEPWTCLPLDAAVPLEAGAAGEEEEAGDDD